MYVQGLIDQKNKPATFNCDFFKAEFINFQEQLSFRNDLTQLGIVENN